MTGVLTVVTIGGLAAPALAAGLAAKPSTSASASASPSPCDAVVSDTTAAHVLHADSAVTKAAAQLEAKGADVRVRAFDTAPDGSLSSYEESQLTVCPSWSRNGEIKPNLLVFLVSLDHKVGIFYGANYSSLQNRVNQISADMATDFSKSDFSGGIAKGEQETYSALYSSKSSTTQSSPQPQSQSRAGFNPTSLVVVVVIVIGVGFLIRRFFWRKQVG